MSANSNLSRAEWMRMIDKKRNFCGMLSLLGMSV